MKSRFYLTGVLLIASTALAQTTTTTTTLPGSCVDAPANELDAALAADPAAAGAWTHLTAYAKRAHFDTSQYKRVIKCTINGKVAYIATFATLRGGRPDAGLRYLPTNPASEQVKLSFQKNAHTFIELGPTGGHRILATPDGSFRRMRLLDGAGRPLHLSKTTTTLALAARRRHL